MLPIAHMGITVTIVRMLEKKFTPNWIDYRVLLVASLLPDIIDKPVARLVFDHSLREGREFGHSLAFIMILVGIGFIYRYWWKNSLIATICLGTTVHDMLDVMWRHPSIFFWPLYGWNFPPPVNEAWQGFITLGAIHVSQLRALDITGALMLLYFLANLALNGRIIDFLKRGRIQVPKCELGN